MKRRENGQSMVEMALILPFLVLILIGIIELSYYIYTYSELENATRRASERAARTPPFDPANAGDLCAKLSRDAAIAGVTLSALKPSNITFSFVPANSVRRLGTQIEVTTDYSGQFLTPVGRQAFGNTLRFRFTSRRTISSLDPPIGYNANCSAQ